MGAETVTPSRPPWTPSRMLNCGDIVAESVLLQMEEELREEEPVMRSEPQSPGARKLLLGTKLNASCREMVAWTLAELARPGDHILAFHVSNFALHSVTTSKEHEAHFQQLANTLRGYLSVFEGLCTLKEIGLEVEIIPGVDVKRVLVEFARSHQGCKLVLGTNKHFSLRRNKALGKYCLKRLPLTCTVVILKHGEIILNEKGKLSEDMAEKDPGTRPGTGMGVLKTLRRSMKSIGRSKKVMNGASDEGPDDTPRPSVSLQLTFIELRHGEQSIGYTDHSTELEKCYFSDSSVFPEFSSSIMGSSKVEIESSDTFLLQEQNGTETITPARNPSVHASATYNEDVEDPSSDDKIVPGWPLMHHSIGFENANFVPSAVHGPISADVTPASSPVHLALFDKAIPDSSPVHCLSSSKEKPPPSPLHRHFSDRLNPPPCSPHRQFSNQGRPPASPPRRLPSNKEKLLPSPLYRAVLDKPKPPPSPSHRLSSNKERPPPSPQRRPLANTAKRPPSPSCRLSSNKEKPPPSLPHRHMSDQEKPSVSPPDRLSSNKETSRAPSPLHPMFSEKEAASPSWTDPDMSTVDWAPQLQHRNKEVLNSISLLTKEDCVKILGEIARDAFRADSDVNEGIVTQPNLEGSSNDSYGANKVQLSLNFPGTSQQSRLEGDKLSLAERSDCLCKDRRCTAFLYEDLEAATTSFSSSNVVGRGGGSEVYRGQLPDGKLVAVKRLNYGPQAEEELLNDIEINTSLSHPHIVSLLGYCVDSAHLILVYNYLPEGNLEDRLHAGTKAPVLPWHARYKIAVGIAKALDYLHHGTSRPVIHRDVKASNILLTDEFEAQLSDFGLAKWAPAKASYILCDDILGTFGYLAPEYFMYGRVNNKTDVYAFGVVLLELITGQTPVNTTRPKGQENLVNWAKPLLEENSLSQLVDSRLEGVYNVEQLNRMILAASLCVRQSAQRRPRISQVLQVLCSNHAKLHNFRTRSDESMTSLDLEECDGNITENPTFGRYTTDVQTHLALAMLGVDDDISSQCSLDHSRVDLLHSSKYLEEYIESRFSRSANIVN